MLSFGGYNVRACISIRNGILCRWFGGQVKIGLMNSSANQCRRQNYKTNFLKILLFLYFYYSFWFLFCFQLKWKRNGTPTTWYGAARCRRYGAECNFPRGTFPPLVSATPKRNRVHDPFIAVTKSRPLNFMETRAAIADDGTPVYCLFLWLMKPMLFFLMFVP